MLEPLRQYALEDLRRSAQLSAVHVRFAAHFSRLAETAGSRLASREGQRWLQALDVELDNVRAVLAMEQVDAGDRLRVAVALLPYWHFRALLTERRQRLGRLV